MNETFRLRDNRTFGLFIIEDQLIDKHGAELGVYGVAVYAVLARHANGMSEAVMSAPAIAARLGCGDRKVRDVLHQLEELNLIERKPNHDSAGARTADTITLQNITPLHHMQGPPASHAPKISTTTSGGGGEKPITTIWEEETRQPITPLMADDLHDLVEDFTYEWVVDAIKEAVQTLGPGRFGIKYATSILARWRREGRAVAKPVLDPAAPPAKYKKVLT